MLVPMIVFEFLKVFIENVGPLEELRRTVVLILLIRYLLIVSFHLSSEFFIFDVLE